MKQKISKIKDKILDLIYPKNIKCMFCASELNQNSYNCTCEECLQTLPFIKNPCARCGSPMYDNQMGVCLKCKNHNYNFVEAKSVFEYTDLPLNVVQNLKYNGKKYLVEYMVDYLTDIYGMWNVFADIIVNVPMFKAKEKLRGYNQSKLLAEEFARKVNVPFYEMVRKIKDTPSQTELNTRERINNILGSFEFNDEFKKIVKNKVVLIIDDVITTGATTSEVSRILLKAGAKECYVLSFAHTRLQKIDFELTDN